MARTKQETPKGVRERLARVLRGAVDKGLDGGVGEDQPLLRVEGVEAAGVGMQDVSSDWLRARFGRQVYSWMEGRLEGAGVSPDDVRFIVDDGFRPGQRGRRSQLSKSGRVTYAVDVVDTRSGEVVQSYFVKRPIHRLHEVDKARVFNRLGYSAAAPTDDQGNLLLTPDGNIFEERMRRGSSIRDTGSRGITPDDGALVGAAVARMVYQVFQQDLIYDFGYAPAERAGRVRDAEKHLRIEFEGAGGGRRARVNVLDVSGAIDLTEFGGNDFAAAVDYLRGDSPQGKGSETEAGQDGGEAVTEKFGREEAIVGVFKQVDEMFKACFALMVSRNAWRAFKKTLNAQHASNAVMQEYFDLLLARTQTELNEASPETWLVYHRRVDRPRKHEDDTPYQSDEIVAVRQHLGGAAVGGGRLDAVVAGDILDDMVEDVLDEARRFNAGFSDREGHVDPRGLLFRAQQTDSGTRVDVLFPEGYQRPPGRRVFISYLIRGSEPQELKALNRANEEGVGSTAIIVDSDRRQVVEVIPTPESRMTSLGQDIESFSRVDCRSLGSQLGVKVRDMITQNLFHTLTNPLDCVTVSDIRSDRDPPMRVAFAGWIDQNVVDLKTLPPRDRTEIFGIQFWNIARAFQGLRFGASAWVQFENAIINNLGFEHAGVNFSELFANIRSTVGSDEFFSEVEVVRNPLESPERIRGRLTDMGSQNVDVTYQRILRMASVPGRPQQREEFFTSILPPLLSAVEDSEMGVDEAVSRLDRVGEVFDRTLNLRLAKAGPITEIFGRDKHDLYRLVRGDGTALRALTNERTLAVAEDLSHNARFVSRLLLMTAAEEPSYLDRLLNTEVRPRNLQGMRMEVGEGVLAVQDGLAKARGFVGLPHEDVESLQNCGRQVAASEGFRLVTEDREPLASATSVAGLRGIIDGNSASAVVFHVGHRDFQRWCRHAVCDTVLADRLSRVQITTPDDTKREVLAVLDARLGEAAKLKKIEDMTPEERAREVWRHQVDYLRKYAHAGLVRVGHILLEGFTEMTIENSDKPNFPQIMAAHTIGHLNQIHEETSNLSKAVFQAAFAIAKKRCDEECGEPKDFTVATVEGGAGARREHPTFDYDLFIVVSDGDGVTSKGASKDEYVKRFQGILRDTVVGVDHNYDRDFGIPGRHVISPAEVNDYLTQTPDLYWDAGRFIDLMCSAGDTELASAVISPLENFIHNTSTRDELPEGMVLRQVMSEQDTPRSMALAGMYGLRLFRDEEARSDVSPIAPPNLKYDLGGLREVNYVAWFFRLGHGIRERNPREVMQLIRGELVDDVSPVTGQPNPLTQQERAVLGRYYHHFRDSYQTLMYWRSRMDMHQGRNMKSLRMPTQELSAFANSLGYSDAAGGETAVSQLMGDFEVHKARVQLFFKLMVEGNTKLGDVPEPVAGIVLPEADRPVLASALSKRTPIITEELRRKATEFHMLTQITTYANDVMIDAFEADQAMQHLRQHDPPKLQEITRLFGDGENLGDNDDFWNAVEEGIDAWKGATEAP